MIAEALWYIGRCYEHKLDFASALESYQQLLKDVSPEKITSPVGKGWYEEAKFNIGYCYLQLQNYEKAYRVWEEVLREEQGKGSDLYYVTKRVLKNYKQVIASQPFPAQEKQRGTSKLLGPIYGIFMDYKMEFRRIDSILIVYGTQSKNPEENQACEYLANKVKEYLGKRLVCKKDTELSQEEIRSKNLVLIGTPSSNKVLANLSGSLPIKIGTDITIEVADRLYKGEDLGVIMVAPHPLNEELFVLVYSAFQPSLLRNIFSVYHGGTDYIIFSTQSLSERVEPDPEKPSLEEGYFFKSPGKWQPFFSATPKK
ncbi:tetratricopeptide repeat protein [bacterium]|nr:tetratricopeptide repeat protein [bacterium]